ncbi:MAG: hypothetical protein ABSF64_21200 [Bryobacteraceae bacterium]
MTWVLRKDGETVQFADNRHAADEVLERYSMGRLGGPELAGFEEHLLVCESCQDRLAREDSFSQGMRHAGVATVLEQPRTAVPRYPRLAWALGLTAVGLVVFAGIGWRSVRRSTDAPVVILLQATRGPENPTLAAAPAGKPLTLLLDLTDLPQFSAYKLEIVDAGGHPAFQSAESPRNGRLQATLARGLPAGAYFVRLYNPAGQLLREYSLR